MGPDMDAADHGLRRELPATSGGGGGGGGGCRVTASTYRGVRGAPSPPFPPTPHLLLLTAAAPVRRNPRM